MRSTNLGLFLIFAIVLSFSLIQRTQAQSLAVGDHRVLAIVAGGFTTSSSATIDNNYSVEFIRDLLSKLKSYYFENSYGMTTFSRIDVVAVDIGKCDVVELKNHVKQLGYDINIYDRFIYYFSRASGCVNFNGLAEGNQVWVTALNQYALGTTIHELGHTFGLGHAGSLNCDGGVVTGANCVVASYSDLMDPMGNYSQSNHMSIIGKEVAGWAGVSNPSAKIENITVPGIYKLAPLETSGNLPRGLKVVRGYKKKPFDDSVASYYEQSYYLELRQAVGFDAVLDAILAFSADPNQIYNGVLFHLNEQGSGIQSVLLDMTPDSSLSPDTLDAALTVGKSYSDVDAGLNFQVNSLVPQQEISVQINHLKPRNRPIAANDSATTTSGQSVVVPVLSNDIDPDADVLRIVAVDPPVINGVVLGSTQVTIDNKIAFTPSATATGTVSFSYLITDGIFLSRATVQVSIGSTTTTTSPTKKGGGKSRPR